MNGLTVEDLEAELEECESFRADLDIELGACQDRMRDLEAELEQLRRLKVLVEHLVDLMYDAKCGKPGAREAAAEAFVRVLEALADD